MYFSLVALLTQFLLPNCGMGHYMAEYAPTGQILCMPQAILFGLDTSGNGFYESGKDCTSFAVHGVKMWTLCRPIPEELRGKK